MGLSIVPIFIRRLDYAPDERPSDSWVVVESASHLTAPNSVREKWPDAGDAVTLREVPEDKRHEIPSKLIGRRVTRELADRLMIKCGIEHDDWWFDVAAWDPTPEEFQEFLRKIQQDITGR
jgi:hypothetical protein